MNQLISPIILVLCFSSSVMIMTSICINFGTISEKKFYFPFIFFYSFLILSLTYVCELIPQNIENFCNSIQYKLSTDQSMNEIHIQYIQLLDSIKHEIYFSPFGMFQIRFHTLLSVSSLVITYVIIIIQTSSAT